MAINWAVMITIRFGEQLGDGREGYNGLQISIPMCASKAVNLLPSALSSSVHRLNEEREFGCKT